LDKLLLDRTKPLSDEDKMNLVKGIARGMLHLHNHNIIHRDLAARNILLSATGEPKISVLSTLTHIHIHIHSLPHSITHSLTFSTFHL
jgi:serine/threonine protein kinase